MKVGQRQFTNIVQQSGESCRTAGRKPGLRGQFLHQQTTGDGVSPKTSISKNEAAMGAEQKVDRQGEIRQDGGLELVSCRFFRPRSPILRNQGGYKIQA